MHKRFDDILVQISQAEAADVLEPEASSKDDFPAI